VIAVIMHETKTRLSALVKAVEELGEIVMSGVSPSKFEFFIT